MVKSSRATFFGVMIVLAILYIGGCRNLGTWLVKEEVPPHADAMVLLMGNFPDRVLQAADLYHDGKAGKLIIVEESMGPFKVLESRGAEIISNTKQAKNSAIVLGIPADCITILPGDARDTKTEAMATREYLADNVDIDTLLLVSSPSHLRRASMIFKAALRDSETTVFVGCSPSAYSSFNADRWWHEKEGIQTVLNEVVKIGSFVVFERRHLKMKN